jgi:uncharacterized protein (TIGR00255 family)
MTGFGVASLENSYITIYSEIKTLNSKFLDISLKFSRPLSTEKELELKSILKDYLERGKIVANLDFQIQGSLSTAIEINAEIIKTYIQELKIIAQEMQITDHEIMRLAMQMPDSTQNTSQKDQEIIEKHWQDIKNIFIESLKKCNEFRKIEGNALQESLFEQGKNIQKYLIEINELDKKRIPQIKQRIQQRLQEFLQNEAFDENRLEQEMIFYAEKLDISEEKDRLRQHITLYLEKLNSQEANGKVLNFISQEMGREINTIGSKANDAPIQHLVVKMKEELEKIKEQTLNIL